MDLIMDIEEKKSNEENNESNKELKSELQIKKEENYFKIINNCLLGFKDKIRIMKRNYEKDTIKIYIEILKNGDKELIHLKNASFYSHDELMQNLINKFNKIVKTHHID